MKRHVKQIAGPIDGRLFALADDGTVWVLGSDIGEWWKVPGLPVDTRRGEPVLGEPDHVSLADAAISLKELARLIGAKIDLVDRWPSALRRIARSLELHANKEK